MNDKTERALRAEVAALKAERDAAVTLLVRAVKYAKEDRMNTGRATRLERCLNEARRLVDALAAPAALPAPTKLSAVTVTKRDGQPRIPFASAFTVGHSFSPSGKHDPESCALCIEAATPEEPTR